MVPLQDPVDDPVVLGAVPGPVHLDPIGGGLPLEFLEVFGQPGERVCLDALGGAAQRLPLRNGGGGPVALHPDEPERLVVPVGPLVVLHEGPRLLGMGVDHRESLAFSSISATCTTGSFVPSRRARPSRCMRQDMSYPAMTSAPARTWSAMRSRPIMQE